MGFEGGTAVVCAENAAVSHGNAQGFRVFRAGKREENGGSRAAVGQGTAKVCMPCLFAWFFFVIRGGYAQRNTFFGRSGWWQRASCD